MTRDRLGFIEDRLCWRTREGSTWNCSQRALGAGLAGARNAARSVWPGVFTGAVDGWD